MKVSILGKLFFKTPTTTTLARNSLFVHIYSLYVQCIAVNVQTLTTHTAHYRQYSIELPT